MPSPLLQPSARTVAGIAFIYDKFLPGSGAGYIPAEVFETQQRDNAVATNTAIDRFTAASARAGVSAEPLTLSVSFASAGDQFGRIARHFDLSVVGQAEPETSAIEEKIVEAALFDSGRPVIVVPYIQKAPLKLDRVMVCWDGSRSARALPSIRLVTTIAATPLGVNHPPMRHSDAAFALSDADFAIAELTCETPKNQAALGRA
jgi:hypothetical protein